MCIATDTITIAMPAWFSALAGFFLLILPPIGLVSGILGLIRSITHPQMHGRWLAVIGLLVGMLWLVATQFL